MSGVHMGVNKTPTLVLYWASTAAACCVTFMGQYHSEGKEFTSEIAARNFSNYNIRSFFENLGSFVYAESNRAP